MLSNPGVGMIFLIPGMNEEVLRINGTASITKDEFYQQHGLDWQNDQAAIHCGGGKRKMFHPLPEAFKQAELVLRDLGGSGESAIDQ